MAAFRLSILDSTYEEFCIFYKALYKLMILLLLFILLFEAFCIGSLHLLG